MSTFGRYFRVTTFGESHGKAVGVITDGVPPFLEISESDIQPQLDRRRPGQSALTTSRNELDTVCIQSGVENGLTLGSPICLTVNNFDMYPKDYSNIRNIPRPSHADYTYQQKYGIRTRSGGGRSSARETIGRVAGGAIAEKWLRERYGVEVVAWVSSVGGVELDQKLVDLHGICRADVDRYPSRCPNEATHEIINQLVCEAKADDDSLGGVITCVCRNVPPGWGEPCFDKLEALLAHAMLSIPATKGFEIGSGFAGTKLRGSQHNDPFILRPNGQLGTLTNNSGGIQGGISNGENIIFKVAFKPAATIAKPQKTTDFDGNSTVLEAKGRHDPCILPRAVPIVESMAALVLADCALLQIPREHLKK